MDMLLRFIEGLKKRKDVEIQECRRGRALSEEVLEDAALPEDLKALYRSMDGCDLAWSFKEKPLEKGSLHIPSFEALRFRRAHELGISRLSKEQRLRSLALIDEHQPEGVCFIDKNSGAVLFENLSAKDGLQPAAESLGEYLERGVRRGFGFYWMTDHALALETERRLKEKPAAPEKKGPGSRIVLRDGAAGGRLGGYGRIEEKEGPYYFVRLDHGPRCWSTAAGLDLCGPDDPYEALRTRPDELRRLLAPAQTADSLLALLPELTGGDPHRQRGCRLMDYEGMEWVCPDGGISGLKPEGAPEDHPLQPDTVLLPSLRLTGLLSVLPPEEVPALLIGLLELLAEQNPSEVPYGSEGPLAFALRLLMEGLLIHLMGRWKEGEPPFRLLGEALFSRLESALHPFAALPGDPLPYGPALFREKLYIHPTFYGRVSPLRRPPESESSIRGYEIAYQSLSQEEKRRAALENKG